jgi:hypothetical protein
MMVLRYLSLAATFVNIFLFCIFIRELRKYRREAKERKEYIRRQYEEYDAYITQHGSDFLRNSKKWNSHQESNAINQSHDLLRDH